MGNISSGCMSFYVPKLVAATRGVSGGKDGIDKPQLQYLLLHALRELITGSVLIGSDSLTPFLDEIWQLLFDFCGSFEEGTRNVVAECLGKLTLVHSEEFLPRLCASVSSPVKGTRGLSCGCLLVAINLCGGVTNLNIATTYISLMMLIVTNLFYDTNHHYEFYICCFH